VKCSAMRCFIGSLDAHSLHGIIDACISQNSDEELRHNIWKILCDESYFKSSRAQKEAMEAALPSIKRLVQFSFNNYEYECITLAVECVLQFSSTTLGWKLLCDADGILLLREVLINSYFDDFIVQKRVKI